MLLFCAYRTYTNGKTYLVRRRQDPSDQANAWIYDDNPSSPCSHYGPFYRWCAVCLKSIPAHDFIPLRTFRHIRHYACPKCLDLLLSRGFTKCPICKQPHFYFRVDDSLVSPTTIVPVPTNSQPAQPHPSPRQTSRTLPFDD